MADEKEKDELEKAHGELDLLLNPKTEEGGKATEKALSVTERALDLVKSLLGKGGGDEKKEAAKEEKEADPSGTLAKSLADKYDDAVDALPILTELKDGLTKSLGEIGTALNTLVARVAAQDEETALLKKSMALMLQSGVRQIELLEKSPKSIPMSGVFQVLEKSRKDDAGKDDSLESIAVKLEQGVEQGTLNPDVLARFSTNPIALLKSLGPKTLESLDIQLAA